PWNRLDVFIESYDFARVTASGVKKPRINAGAKVKPAKWLALGSAIEDINEKSDVHTSVNLVLEDEDLSYLLGLIGLVGK
ncbi:MAG: hypothetical protein V2A57_01710, partial [Elusimicrobiota bacterium]